MRGRGTFVLFALEFALLDVGATCVGFYAGTSAAVSRIQTEDRVEVARVLSSDERTPRSSASTDLPELRILGELEIPRIHLFAPIERGDDEGVLQAAVGYLTDTPAPWLDGNSVLAAHRDGLFRSLEHVRVGDDIQLTTLHGEFRYLVRRVLIVKPDDMWVLRPSPHVNLTLITCYPFVYVGHAPRRFIVQAEKMSSGE